MKAKRCELTPEQIKQIVGTTLPSPSYLSINGPPLELIKSVHIVENFRKEAAKEELAEAFVYIAIEALKTDSNFGFETCSRLATDLLGSKKSPLPKALKQRLMDALETTHTDDAKSVYRKSKMSLNKYRYDFFIKLEQLCKETPSIDAFAGSVELASGCDTKTSTITKEQMDKPLMGDLS